jgi:hypothetical protein
MLRPGKPFPVLFLRGEQGSAKSTLARLLRSLIDPNRAILRRPPRDDRDLIIAATNGWVVAFDNLSYMPDWLSDALCCLATGSGFGTRALYTDNEETLFQATRPIILTAIEEIITRGDLLDRCLSIELEAIPDSERRTEAELDEAFAQAHPLILGALLDAAVLALKNLPSTRMPFMPRMADFACWVSAAETALGWKPGEFLKAYGSNRESAHEAVLSDSLLYAPLLMLLEQSGDCWEGTPSQLLEALKSRVNQKVAEEKSWPKKPNMLTNKLKRLAPALRVVGITIERDRQAQTGTRIIKIERTVKDRHSSSPSSPDRNSGSFQGDDGRDNPPDGDNHDWPDDDPGDDQHPRDLPHGDDGDDVFPPPHDTSGPNFLGPYGEGY